MPDMIDQFARQGMAPVASQPGDFAKYLQGELDRWSRAMGEELRRLIGPNDKVLLLPTSGMGAAHSGMRARVTHAGFPKSGSTI